MKAIVLTKYGSPDVLELQEIARPSPKDDEVLVKVHATAVNDWDWSFMRGKPWAYRIFFGLRKPKVRILGVEVAGTVEALGEHVTEFKPGDAVYGDISESGMGGFAEYVSVPKGALCLKPAAMTFEQAAATPHAALLAWQGLVDVGGIRNGQRVLINGAGGGVGTFGVQIAKRYGAEVTGVDHADKFELLQSLGFDRVIDYRYEERRSDRRWRSKGRARGVQPLLLSASRLRKGRHRVDGRPGNRVRRGGIALRRACAMQLGPLRHASR